MTETTDRFWSQIKTDIAAPLLADSIGVIARGKDCWVIHIKSPNTVFVPIRTDSEARVFLWGLGGTETDAREFLSEFTHFLHLFKNDVSPRDINIALAGDFIGAYLAENLYKRKSERPLALEFILGQFSDEEISFSLIDFKGENKRWGIGERFAFIGCAGEKRNKLRRTLSGLKLRNLNAKKLAAVLKSLMGRFKGDTLFSEFTISSLEHSKNGLAKNKI